MPLIDDKHASFAEIDVNLLKIRHCSSAIGKHDRLVTTLKRKLNKLFDVDRFEITRIPAFQQTGAENLSELHALRNIQHDSRSNLFMKEVNVEDQRGRLLMNLEEGKSMPPKPRVDKKSALRHS